MNDPWGVIWRFVKEADWSGTDDFVNDLRACLTTAGLAVVPVQLLAELTDDAEALAQQQYGRSLDYPSMRRKFEASMRPVKRAREIVATAIARQGQPEGEG